MVLMPDYNPSNKYNNMGKKIIIGGLAALVLAGSAIAYNQFASNDDIAPAPYNPPAIIAEVPNIPSTDTPIITTIENQTSTSLEDKLPDYTPLSPKQISEYTLKAYEMGYEANITNDKKRFELAKGWLDRAIYAVAITDFKYEELLALSKPAHEYIYGTLSGTYLAAFEDDVRKYAERLSNDPDKKSARASLTHGFLHGFGGAPNNN
ncbi:MAG: hypothetical protein V1831_00640 [Candidatus Woesearchaeota archaeon]